MMSFPKLKIKEKIKQRRKYNQEEVRRDEKGSETK